MPRNGRPRTPTAILKIRDSWRAKERTGEPVAKAGRPACPLFIAGNALALEAWNHACDELEQMGILATADRMTIAGYCEAVAEFQKLAVEIETSGHLTTTSNGNVIQHPLVGAKNKASERMLKFACQFGLTASARASIGSGSGQKTNGKRNLIVG